MVGEVGRVECVENVASAACGFEGYYDGGGVSARGEEDAVVGVANIACIEGRMLAEDTTKKNSK